MSDRAGSGTPPPPGAAVRARAATMARAAAFLGDRLRLAGDEAIAAPGVPRVIANSLRELDRFLSLLLDEIAEGTTAGDRIGFAGQRNTPNKLRQVRAALGLASPDHERLRAIGRARDRLFHGSLPSRGGEAIRLPGWLRAGGFDGAARPRSIAADLRGVCRLYDRIAGELATASEAAPPRD